MPNQKSALLALVIFVCVTPGWHNMWTSEPDGTYTIRLPTSWTHTTTIRSNIYFQGDKMTITDVTRETLIKNHKTNDEDGAHQGCNLCGVKQALVAFTMDTDTPVGTRLFCRCCMVARNLIKSLPTTRWFTHILSEKGMNTIITHVRAWVEKGALRHVINMAATQPCIIERQQWLGGARFTLQDAADNVRAWYKALSKADQAILMDDAKPMQGKSQPSKASDFAGPKFSNYYWVINADFVGDCTSPLASTLRQVVLHMAEFAQAHEPITFGSKVLLLIAGNAGSGTGWHADPAFALNFVLSLQTTLEPNQVLAYWLLVKPDQDSINAFKAHMSSSPDMHQYFQSELPPLEHNGESNDRGVPVARPALPIKIMQGINAALGPHTMLLEQTHGTCINVPVGWMHAVTNAQPCLKVAFDYLPKDHTQWPRVAATGHTLHSSVFAQRNAEDYMHTMHICLDALLRGH